MNNCLDLLQGVCDWRDLFFNRKDAKARRFFRNNCLQFSKN